MIETFRTVVGHRDDAGIAEQLHRLEHAGAVQHLVVPRADLGRRRFKVLGTDGTEYGIALSRADAVRDGSVVLLSADRAVVVAVEEDEVLELRGTTARGAIQLGWHAGHLHWRVRFGADDTVSVLLDSPREDYLARIAPQLADGSIEVVRP